MSILVSGLKTAKVNVVDPPGTTQQVHHLTWPSEFPAGDEASELNSTNELEKHREIEGVSWTDADLDAKIVRTADRNDDSLVEMDGFKSDGAVRFRLAAVLDEKTCPVCAGLDGSIHEVDEIVGMGGLWYLTHPNCRCVMVPLKYEERLDLYKMHSKHGGKSVKRRSRLLPFTTFDKELKDVAQKIFWNPTTYNLEKREGGLWDTTGNYGLVYSSEGGKARWNDTFLLDELSGDRMTEPAAKEGQGVGWTLSEITEESPRDFPVKSSTGGKSMASKGWPRTRLLREAANKLKLQINDALEAGLPVEGLLDTAHDVMGQVLGGDMPDPDVLTAMQRLLADSGIDYALIGRVAVGAQGAEIFTADIDAVVSALIPEEKAGDPRYMERFGFYRTTSRTGKHMVIDHRRYGQVELLLADTPLRSRAVSTAEELSALGVNAKVANVLALIGLKIVALAANPSRKGKDDIDIVALDQIHKPDYSQLRSYLSDNEWQLLMSLVSKGGPGSSARSEGGEMGNLETGAKSAQSRFGISANEFLAALPEADINYLKDHKIVDNPELETKRQEVVYDFQQGRVNLTEAVLLLQSVGGDKPVPSGEKDPNDFPILQASMIVVGDRVYLDDSNHPGWFTVESIDRPRGHVVRKIVWTFSDTGGAQWTTPFNAWYPVDRPITASKKRAFSEQELHHLSTLLDRLLHFHKEEDVLTSESQVAVLKARQAVEKLLAEGYPTEHDEELETELAKASQARVGVTAEEFLRGAEPLDGKDLVDHFRTYKITDAAELEEARANWVYDFERGKATVDDAQNIVEGIGGPSDAARRTQPPFGFTSGGWYVRTRKDKRILSGPWPDRASAAEERRGYDDWQQLELKLLDDLTGAEIDASKTAQGDLGGNAFANNVSQFLTQVNQMLGSDAVTRLVEGASDTELYYRGHKTVALLKDNVLNAVVSLKEDLHSHIRAAKRRVEDQLRTHLESAENQKIGQARNGVTGEEFIDHLYAAQGLDDTEILEALRTHKITDNPKMEQVRQEAVYDLDRGRITPEQAADNFIPFLGGIAPAQASVDDSLNAPVHVFDEHKDDWIPQKVRWNDTGRAGTDPDDPNIYRDYENTDGSSGTAIWNYAKGRWDQTLDPRGHPAGASIPVWNSHEDDWDWGDRETAEGYGPNSKRWKKSTKRVALEYPGNLGYQEMWEFYQKATEEQILQMESLLQAGDDRAVLALVKLITGKDLEKIADAYLYRDWWNGLDPGVRAELLDATGRDPTYANEEWDKLSLSCRRDLLRAVELQPQEEQKQALTIENLSKDDRKHDPEELKPHVAQARNKTTAQELKELLDTDPALQDLWVFLKDYRITDNPELEEARQNIVYDYSKPGVVFDFLLEKIIVDTLRGALEGDKLLAPNSNDASVDVGIFDFSQGDLAEKWAKDHLKDGHVYQVINPSGSNPFVLVCGPDQDADEWWDSYVEENNVDTTSPDDAWIVELGPTGDLHPPKASNPNAVPPPFSQPTHPNFNSSKVWDRPTKSVVQVFWKAPARLAPHSSTDWIRVAEYPTGDIWTAWWDNAKSRWDVDR